MKNKTKRSNYSFREACRIVKKLNIESQKEWFKSWKKAKGLYRLPYNPEKYYKNDRWEGWDNFLGKKIPENYISLSETYKIIHSLEIKSNSEWNDCYEANMTPKNIPKLPQIAYKNCGWKGWLDFLGKPKESNTLTKYHISYLSYTDIKMLLKSLQLKTPEEYYKFRKSKKRFDLPLAPEIHYKREGYWVNWESFLQINKIPFVSYKEAKFILNTHNINNKKLFYALLKGPSSIKEKIPGKPYLVYSEEWESWHCFFKKQKETYISFQNLKNIVAPMNFRFFKEYKIWWKTTKPKQIPYEPRIVYHKEWKNVRDFLGFLSLEKLKEIIKSNNIRNKEEYHELRRKMLVY